MKQRWLVSVGWGSQQHQVCLIGAAREVVGEREFERGRLDAVVDRTE